MSKQIDIIRIICQTPQGNTPPAALTSEASPSWYSSSTIAIGSKSSDNYKYTTSQSSSLRSREAIYTRGSTAVTATNVTEYISSHFLPHKDHHEYEIEIIIEQNKRKKRKQFLTAGDKLEHIFCEKDHDSVKLLDL